MTWRQPLLFMIVLVALSGVFSAPSRAACSDQKIMTMAGDGKSVKAIAKACNMPVAKVRAAMQNQIDDDDDGVAAATAAPALVPKKLPSGAGLASCDCQGTVPYGDKDPEQRCESGMSIATPCAGYCPPRGIAPWRRVCS